jgi:DNA (cytosine-5)-methyltransferase 1
MNELALFAGAGGGILGGKLLGWRTVCAVEWEAYPASVLCARQNDGLLPPFPIWDDVQTFDGHPWRGIVDVISGGFPCQDISAAGKGAGIDGERSGMWGEMARIIREVRPRFVFVENSPMLTSRGLGRVLGDLASMGFDARWGVLGAADVGANHQRDRIWIVAKWRGQLPHTQHNRIRWWEQQQKSTKKEANASYTNFFHDALRGNSQDHAESVGERGVHIGRGLGSSRQGCEEVAGQSTGLADTENKGIDWRQWEQANHASKSEQRNNDSARGFSNGWPEVSNSSSIGLSGQRQHEQPIHSAQGSDRQTNYAESIGRPDQWAIEPNVGRVAHGVAARVDRLKAIGNGQVPLCAATAWRILNDQN